MKALRQAAAAVAAVAAARDRLERFVFKIEEKTSQDKDLDGAALLESTQRWLADGTAGGSDMSEADYADKLSALQSAFPVRAYRYMIVIHFCAAGSLRLTDWFDLHHSFPNFWSATHCGLICLIELSGRGCRREATPTAAREAKEENPCCGQ